jgi:hypothetical protein
MTQRKDRSRILRRVVMLLPGDVYDYLQKIGYGPVLEGNTRGPANGVCRMVEYCRNVPDNEGGDPMTD